MSTPEWAKDGTLRKVPTPEDIEDVRRLGKVLDRELLEDILRVEREYPAFIGDEWPSVID